MSAYKKHLILARTALMAVGLVIGALFLILAALLKPNTVAAIIHWALVIYGIVVIISQIPGLITGITHLNSTAGVLDLISSALGMALGLALIFYQGAVLVTIVGIYMILFPLLRILVTHDKRGQLRQEWLRMILGLVLILFLPALMNAAFTVIHVALLVLGWAIIALSVILYVISLILIAVGAGTRSQDESGRSTSGGKRLYVDRDGDGTVDVIYEDTHTDKP